MSTVEFERLIGVSNGYVSSISKSIQPDKLEIISDTNPDLNIEWLLIGKGPMLKSEQMSSIQQRLEHFIEAEKINLPDFCKNINLPFPMFRDLNGIISEDRLKKIIEHYPQLSIEWLFAGNGTMLKSDNPITTIETLNLEEGTPLLPVEAWGGSLSGSSIAVLAEQCKKYNVPINNIDYLIPIAGDSMMPDYCPGDIVGIKKINERAFIEWGKVYVLDTCNGVVIKEVQPSENDGCITCISHNLPERYRPFEVSLNPEDFYGMYAVKGTVRIS